MARKPKRADIGVLGTLGRRNLQAARMLFLLLAIGVATRAMAVAPTADAPPSTPLVVDVDGAQLIDLREPAATVFVANPEIADVQVPGGPNTTKFVLFGKKAGSTTVVALAHSGHISSY